MAASGKATLLKDLANRSEFRGQKVLSEGRQPRSDALSHPSGLSYSFGGIPRCPSLIQCSMRTGTFLVSREESQNNKDLNLHVNMKLRSDEKLLTLATPIRPSQHIGVLSSFCQISNKFNPVNILHVYQGLPFFIPPQRVDLLCDAPTKPKMTNKYV